MSPTWATDQIPPWALNLWADGQTRIALVLLGAALLSFFIIPGKPRDTHLSQPRAKDADLEANRPTNTPAWRRLLWRIRPPTDTMRVDGLVIDRSRKPHAAWLGPTGAGKSSAVAAVRVNGQRPTLIATPDVSDPLREATLRLGGFIWTACESTTPVNFLIGSPTEVAERLTEVFRSGGVGAWKRAARQATADVIRTIDAAGEPRSLHGIGVQLAFAVKGDRDLKTVCAGWVARFLDLADQFGPSIGPDGVDLATLLRQGRTVLLDNDSFDHTSLGGDVVALGLAEAKRCASLVPGGFRLIFEEAGQLGERIDLAEPFSRAGRRRKIACDFLTQAESDLNEGINANTATRVYFAQDLKSLQKIAADRLGLDYHALDPANMKDFTAFVSHGRIRRLVKFPKPPRPSRSLHPTIQPDPYKNPPSDPNTRRIIIEEIPAGPGFPGLPPPRLEAQRLLDQLDRSGLCHLWLGSLDKDGYGVTDWKGKRGQRVHRIVYELVYGGIPDGPDGKTLDLDHLCRIRNCARPEHLEPVTRSENVRRRWRIRGVGSASD